MREVGDETGCNLVDQLWRQEKREEHNLTPSFSVEPMR